MKSGYFAGTKVHDGAESCHEKSQSEFEGVVKSVHVAGAIKILLSLKNLRTRDKAFFVVFF